MFVELTSAQQYPVDEDQLSVRLHERRVQRQRGLQRHGRQADAVPSQLDLPGHQVRTGAGRVIVRDPGQFGERLVGAAKPPRHLGLQEVIVRGEVAEPVQGGFSLLVPAGL